MKLMRVFGKTRSRRFTISLVTRKSINLLRMVPGLTSAFRESLTN